MIELRGVKENPQHLSFGMIVFRDSKIAIVFNQNKHTLPRETGYLEESIQRTLERGAEEELGVNIKVSRYIGSLVTQFFREDFSEIEKTTCYFLAEYFSYSTRKPEEYEKGDVIKWLSLEETENIFKKEDNPELSIVDKVVFYTHNK